MLSERPPNQAGVYLLQLLINLAAIWLLLFCLEPLLQVDGFRSAHASAPPVLARENWLELAVVGSLYLGCGWLYGKHVLRSWATGQLTRTRRGLTLLAGPLLAMVIATLGAFAIMAHITLWLVPVAGLAANVLVFAWLRP